VDADKVLLCQKSEDKPLDEYLFQYFHAPLYMDRYEAIEAAAKNQDNQTAQKILIAALKDKFSGLRLKAIAVLNSNKEDIRNLNAGLRTAAISQLTALAATDSNTLVRAAALNTLVILKDEQNRNIFITGLHSESYEVQAAALNGISLLDPTAALQYAKNCEKDNEGALTQAIVRVYATSGGDAQWPFVYQRYLRANFQDQIHLTARFSDMIGRLADPADAQKGIEELKQLGVQYKGSGAAPYLIKFLTIIKERRTEGNDPVSATAAENAINAIGSAK
jgi:aminopeptidase N